MDDFVPSTRPRITKEEALRRASLKENAGPCVIALRGYYQETREENRRGIYDDAICIVGPEHFSAYNANTDPSVFRSGIASLIPGTWFYKPGIHGLSKPKAQQYQAFVQAQPVTVRRDQKGNDTGWFGINIHRGGRTGTSSLGCQTIPPDQWEAFRSSLMDQLKRTGQKTFAYHLVG